MAYYGYPLKESLDLVYQGVNMGWLFIVFTYALMGGLVLLLGPLLFAFVTKKIVIFQHARFKEYVLFWILLVLINLLMQILLTAVFQLLNGSVGYSSFLSSHVNIGFLLSFISQVMLSKFVFQVPYLQAFKASLIYSLLFSVSFAILAVLGILLGVNLLTELK